MSPAAAQVVCAAPGPPSEPGVTVKTDAPAEGTAQSAVRNGEPDVSQNHLVLNLAPSDLEASA